MSLVCVVFARAVVRGLFFGLRWAQQVRLSSFFSSTAAGAGGSGVVPSPPRGVWMLMLAPAGVPRLRPRHAMA